MSKRKSNMTSEIAQAARVFHQQWAGHRPRSVRVDLDADTCAITLHGACSLAEEVGSQALSSAPTVRKVARLVCISSSAAFRQRIRQLIDVTPQEAAEITLSAGALGQECAPVVQGCDRDGPACEESPHGPAAPAGRGA